MFASRILIGGKARSSCRNAVVVFRKGKIRKVTNSSFVFAVALGFALKVRAKRIKSCLLRLACSGICRNTWCTKGAVT